MLLFHTLAHAKSIINVCAFKIYTLKRKATSSLNTWDCLKMLLLFNLLYVIIDLTVDSSMENRTCLMYDSSHDKNNSRFIELCL